MQFCLGTRWPANHKLRLHRRTYIMVGPSLSCGWHCGCCIFRGMLRVVLCRACVRQFWSYTGRGATRHNESERRPRSGKGDVKTLIVPTFLSRVIPDLISRAYPRRFCWHARFGNPPGRGVTERPRRVPGGAPEGSRRGLEGPRISAGF